MLAGELFENLHDIDEEGKPAANSNCRVLDTGVHPCQLAYGTRRSTEGANSLSDRQPYHVIHCADYVTGRLCHLSLR